MINRKLTGLIRKYLFKGKAVLITGPRQSGKTTLIRQFINSTNHKAIWFNCDEADVRESFRKPTTTVLKGLFGDAEIIVFDEAQRIENVGICLKLCVDTFPNKQFIATGSSSLEIGDSLNESLTGRKWEYTLLPFSFQELVDNSSPLEEKRQLEKRLIYGSYPEIVNFPHEAATRLQLLTDSYLYKDILMWDKIKKHQKIEKLVQAIALQLGNEVSFNELGSLVGLDNETVEKYVILLEKAFILFRLPAFSRNMRNELKKNRKIYFLDTGIRNAIIKNFAPLSLRNDTGALWENYLIIERFKMLHYNEHFVNRYFWRTRQQQEIDYIEEYAGRLHAYEFKWNSHEKAHIPLSFLHAYPDSSTEIISQENYHSFLSAFSDN